MSIVILDTEEMEKEKKEILHELLQIHDFDFKVKGKSDVSDWEKKKNQDNGNGIYKEIGLEYADSPKKSFYKKF